MDIYKIYEEEKKKLQKMNLTPKEYEEKLKELCELLGL